MSARERLLICLVMLAALADGFLFYRYWSAASAPPIVSRAPLETVEICKGKTVSRDADGRLLNHFPYPASDSKMLVRPPNFAGGNCHLIHADVKSDLGSLLLRARQEIVADLYAVSCYRSPTYQIDLFCGARARGIPPRLRAETVAPPGYSEHHTGYGIDFGSARSAACEFQTCYGETRAGQWLRINAPRYGFEMSFPPGNRQGVSAEPWHWRWVGDSQSAASGRARRVFDPARRAFPSPFGEMAHVGG
jgi:zinc D-Ala-D-Ala carboxypeptidase